MIEVRCKLCGHLLFKVAGDATGYLEIKCSRRSGCKAINRITLPLPNLRAPIGADDAVTEGAGYHPPVSEVGAQDVTPPA